MNNTTTLGQSIVRNRVSAASLRREQEDAKLRGLDWYKKYPGITRVWMMAPGKRGYAGGILRTNRDQRTGERIKATFDARTFDENGQVKQSSGPLTSHRAALLWLANVNGL
jgi:hypothetical protein